MRRIDLLGVDEVADGEMKMVWVDGTDQVLVINNGGDFTAVQGVCSHEYFELDKGFLTAGTLTCALHLSRFDLSSGEPLDPPAEMPLEVYPVVVENGRVSIDVPDGPLPVSEQ
jgi:3-phenylpropionate/trans-cinnamate dioxygenase ferredoxin component